jgi:tetratricopeptide (TPR) repeat protein
MNRKFAPQLTTLIAVCIVFVQLNALRPDFQSIISSYEKGELERCGNLINKSQPESPEESSVVLYFKAMLSTEVDSVRNHFQSLISTYPQTPYGQQAMLDLGCLSLLDREYSKALEFFNSITDPGLTEKHYWIANTYLQKGDYSNAINSGNQFIRLNRTSSRLEDTYFLVTDAYISLNQFNNAITTLKKLLSQPDQIHDEQYLRYRYGYAAEMLGYRAEAISQYRQGYEINRFSQLAYLIEDRLFEMYAGPGPSIDLSFLYPHSELPPPDIVLAEANKANKTIETENPDSTGIIKPEDNKIPADSTQSGLYLQAGRFSVQANADRLGERIGKLGQPTRVLKSTQFRDISWLVIVGPYQTQLNAVSAKQLLMENEIESFIIQR